MGFTSSMDLPKNYEQARQFFEGRRDKANHHRTVGNNTQVWELAGQGEPCYSIKLHQTHIIIYYPDGRVELDNYDSPVTNDRRHNAGKPTIHGITGLASGKVNRLLVDRRWVVRNAHYDLPYGLPADMALMLNPDGSVRDLEHIKEYVWTPRVEDQRQRKALIRWARKTIKPVVESMQALEAFSRGIAGWAFAAADLEVLRDDGTEGAIAEFIDKHLEVETRWAFVPDPAEALETALRDLTPSAQLNRWRGDELWDKVSVRTIDLPKYLK